MRSDVMRRLASGTGADEVVALERRIERLEEAVTENAALEVPLARIVAELEQALVEPLEHRLRFLSGGPGHR